MSTSLGSSGNTAPAETTINPERGVDLLFDALPFGRLWYTKPEDTIEYGKFYSRSHDALIRVYDESGDVIPNARTHGRV
jgi:hypothetical protein